MFYEVCSTLTLNVVIESNICERTFPTYHILNCIFYNCRVKNADEEDDEEDDEQQHESDGDVDEGERNLLSLFVKKSKGEKKTWSPISLEARGS